MSSVPEAKDPSRTRSPSAPSGLMYSISDDSIIHDEDGEDDSFMVVEVGGVGRQMDTRESWDIPGEDIDTLQILGNGEYGEVWKGLWKRPAGKALDVAIKSIKTSQTQDPEKLDEFIEELVDEATLMENFNHKHVVTLFGTSYKGGNPMIVMEFCPLGELKNFVMQYKLKLKETTLVLSYVCQIAEACQYLHEQSIIHRDLAARNILVKNPETVKVADFGLSRYCEDTYMIQGNKQLPLKWMPPECIRFRKHNFKSDVWMYAVCAWEVLSYGKKPFANLRDNYLKALQRGVRLKKPVGCPQPIFNTLQTCWSYEWAARPSFGEVVEQIKAVLSLWPKFNDPLPNVQWSALNGGTRDPAGDDEFAFLRPLPGPSRGPSPQVSMANSPGRSGGPSPVPCGRSVNRQNPFANDVDSPDPPSLMMMKRRSSLESRSVSPDARREQATSAGKSVLDMFKKNTPKPEVKKSKSTDNFFKVGKGKNPFANSVPSSPVPLGEGNTSLTTSMPSMPPMTPDAGPAQDMSTPLSRFAFPSPTGDRLSKSSTASRESMQLNDSFAEQFGLIGLEDPEDLEALGLIIDEPPEELGLIGLDEPTEAAPPDHAPPDLTPLPDDENALSPEMAEEMGLILDLGDSAEELGLILDATPEDAAPLDPEVERKRAREAKRAARRAKKLQKAKDEAERTESGGREHRSMSAPAAMNAKTLAAVAGAVEVLAEEPDQAAAVTQVAPSVLSKKKTPPPVSPKKKKVAPAVLAKPSSRAPAAVPTPTFLTNNNGNGAEEQPEEEEEEEEENDYSVDLTPGTVSRDRVYKFYGTISWTIYSSRPSATAAKSGIGISTRVKALVQDSVHLKELGSNPTPDLYTPIVVRLGRQFENIITETRAHMSALTDWGRIARMKRAATSMGPKLQNFFENAAEASVSYASDGHQSLWEATTKAATSLAVGSVTLSDLANPNRSGGYEFFRPNAKA